MKIKHYVATCAALAFLAGCSEREEMGTQGQSVAPAVTNEAKEPAPVPPPPPASKEAGSAAIPAPPAAVVTNSPPPAAPANTNESEPK